MTDRRLEQSRSFGAAAGAYQRGRPPYPAAAIDWLVPAGVRRILDLGAGTGKLTRLLADRGFEVLAVEPIAEMRAELTRAVPGVQVLEGVAENIPLRGRSVDLVLAAQAWHWVDPALATAEVARVLAPGGTLGLVWNIRDERMDWVAELGRIIAGGSQEDRGFDLDSVPLVGAPFGPLEQIRIEWTHRLQPDALVDLVASRSYVITLRDRQRARLLGDVRRLIQGHPDLMGSEVEVPYVTLAFRTRVQ